MMKVWRYRPKVQNDQELAKLLGPPPEKKEPAETEEKSK